MRLSSFRVRVLLAAIVFSILLVGTVLTVAYFVVAAGMARIGEGTALSLSRQATRLVQNQVAAAQQSAALDSESDPKTGSERGQRLFVDALPELFRTGMLEGRFALYSPGRSGSLVKQWESPPGAGMASDDADRKRALRLAGSTISSHGAAQLVSGMWTKARLGLFSVHVPIDVPNGERWVLDVVYMPNREEQTIDAIRTPMTILAILGTALAVAIMQTSMGFALRLVDELRLAADSVDAGQLDVMLPEYGQHEIGDLARSLNRLIARLRRRAEAQTRFIADASHELATPVAGIRGYVNILRAWGSEDESVRDEAIRAIDRESRRMVRLCSELLSVIRSEHDVTCRRDSFDLNAVCREVLAGAATRYMDNGLEFVGPDEGRLLLDSDPDKIEQVLAILVDNAAKYTPSGGSVEVRTRRKRDKLVVEVSDTGVGIPQKDLANVFDRFYRSDTSRAEETGGFGLGLAIAKRMTETCGGAIDVESLPGRGTTFTITLPRGRS